MSPFRNRFVRTFTSPPAAFFAAETCEQPRSTDARARHRTAPRSPPGVSTPDKTKMRGTQLTERQREVLDDIREHVRRHGVPPSHSDITKSLKLASGSSAAYHLQALAKKGWIAINPGMDRGIPTAPRRDAGVRPRPVARGGCGDADPRRREQGGHAGARRARPADPPQADSYLTIRGDSMSCVGYQTGDIIAVKRTPDASDGDIVVARIDADVTVKCFHRTGRTGSSSSRAARTASTRRS